MVVDIHPLRYIDVVDGEPLFRMLATIRACATEQFEASGEAETGRHRHALTMMEIARRARCGPGGEQAAESLALLEGEHDNRQAALIYLAQADEMDRDDNGVDMRTGSLSSR
jgi:hypothetical protein